MRAYLNTINNPWRVFDELMTEFPYDLFNNTWRTRSGYYPRVNVWESEKGLVVEAEVAGVDPEKMDVAVDANVLTLKGEREQADGAKSEFQRSFNLPFELDKENIKAAMKNGILTVSIPRKVAAEKRKILIENQ
jgi:HSP20 family protein